MKATIDVPGDLYRRVKAEAALRGVTVREVTTRLYRRWLSEGEETSRGKLRRLGTGRYLRSGDALYAALAEGLEGEVVTWDMELVERAGALTPREWIDARSRGRSPDGPAGSP